MKIPLIQIIQTNFKFN